MRFRYTFSGKAINVLLKMLKLRTSHFSIFSKLFIKITINGRLQEKKERGCLYKPLSFLLSLYSVGNS